MVKIYILQLDLCKPLLLNIFFLWLKNYLITKTEYFINFIFSSSNNHKPFASCPVTSILCLLKIKGERNEKYYSGVFEKYSQWDEMAVNEKEKNNSSERYTGSHIDKMLLS